MQADRETAALYRRQGWIKIDRLAAGERLARLQREASEHVRRTGTNTWNTGVQAYQASPAFQSILKVVRDIMKDNPETTALARELGALVRDLEGWRAARFYSDRLLIKTGRSTGGEPTKWHQDFPKWPFDRRGATTVWLALTDVPKSRGPMTFLNGSHRLGPLGAVDLMKEEKDLSELLLEDDWQGLQGCSTATPMASGDATIHNALTVHRAGRNMDEEDRVVLALTYFDADALYNGASSPITDGLGLTPYKPFDHASFPIVP